MGATTALAEIAEYPLDGPIKSFTVLDSDTLLCTRTLYDESNTDPGYITVEFFTLKLSSGDTEPWECDWSYADDGWDYAGSVFGLRASPDGKWVIFDQAVRHTIKPDEADTDRLTGDTIGTMATILCKPDGTDARVLSVTSGNWQYGSPLLTCMFTSDSERVLGFNWANCAPDASSFLEYLRSKPSYPERSGFTYIDINTGKSEFISCRIGHPSNCPYSENFWATNRLRDPKHMQFPDNAFKTEYWFGSFQTGEVEELHIPSGDDQELGVLGWALEDAILVRNNNQCGLLYYDGRFIVADDPGWNVYCWLPDNTYVFSTDNGKHVLHGKVDWPSFTIEWSVEVPELVPFIKHYKWLYILPDSSGVVLIGDGYNSLFYIPLNPPDTNQ